MSAGNLRIVNFHGIGMPLRPLEDGEEHYWISENRYSQFLDQIAQVRDRVLITFDDGNLSDLDIGARGLANRGLTATFFPLAGRLDENGSLGPNHLKELQHLGHNIGSHGFDHVSWKSLDDMQAHRELVEARTKLEECIGETISEAAIPFGLYGRSTLRRLKSAGYSRVFSSDGGCYSGSPFPVPRWSVKSDTSPEDMENFLSGREGFARKSRRALAKLRKQVL